MEEQERKENKMNAREGFGMEMSSSLYTIIVLPVYTWTKSNYDSSTSSLSLFFKFNFA